MGKKDMTDWIVVRDTSGTKLEGTLSTDAAGEIGFPGVREFSIAIEAAEEGEIAELKDDPRTIAVAADMPIALIEPESSDDDTLETAQGEGVSWGVLEVAEKADVNAGTNVKVAVLDTGIDQSHSAFAGVEFTSENYSDSITAEDLNGHGTHCAATIFGRDTNGVRIGVARGVREVFSAKVLNDAGVGSSKGMVQAIQAAHHWGANVISLSAGIDFPKMVESLEFQGYHRKEAVSRGLAQFRDTVRMFDAVSSLLARPNTISVAGSVFVAAAGNSSRRNNPENYCIDVEVPAASTDVVSVGSVRRSDIGFAIADSSCVNPTMSAPGVGIVSAKIGGGLVASSGTSMAAPHVAGLSVLWWESLPPTIMQNKAQIVVASLLNSCISRANPLPLSGRDFGAGVPMSPE